MHYKQTFSQKTIDVGVGIFAPLWSGDVLPWEKYGAGTGFVGVDRKQNFVYFGF